VVFSWSLAAWLKCILDLGPALIKKYRNRAIFLITFRRNKMVTLIIFVLSFVLSFTVFNVIAERYVSP